MSKSKKKKKQQVKNITSVKTEVKAPPSIMNRQSWIYLAIAIALSFVAHMDNFNNTWVNWDDDKNFQENELVRDITAETFVENSIKIFSSDVIGGYNPLSVWTFAVESLVWGMEDSSWKWWHLDNIILHLICVFFVFLIARQLKIKPLGAFLIALLFGIHPMRVESVAWLTERKDVLFASFYFAALYYYIKGKLQGNEWKYVIPIILLFILSGLSKIQAVSLPLTMIAIDYYIAGKFDLVKLPNKIPYFAMSLVIGLTGYFILSKTGVILDDSNAQYNGLHRLAFGCFAYVQYLGKLIYPWEMSPLYPYPSKFYSFYLLGPVLLSGVIAATIWAWMKEHKVWVFGMLFFTVNIVFVLQIVGAGQGLFADRFTYVPYFGLFFIAGYYFQNLEWKKIRDKVILGAVALYMCFFMYKTYVQTDIWSNSYSMWSHVIKYYPKTKVTWGNRANWLRDNGFRTQALSDYTERIRLGSDDPEPFNSRAKLYFQSNRRDTLLLALEDYKLAVQLAESKQKSNKLKSEYRVNLASTYARLGDNENAVNMFDEAQKFDPNNPNIYFNRSITYHNMGNYKAEQGDIITYLKFKPRDGAMISNLGTTKRLLGDYEGAEKDFNKALKYSQIPPIYLERARNYMAMNMYDLARTDIQTLQKYNVQIPADILQALGM